MWEETRATFCNSSGTQKKFFDTENQCLLRFPLIFCCCCLRRYSCLTRLARKMVVTETGSDVQQLSQSIVQELQNKNVIENTLKKVCQNSEIIVPKSLSEPKLKHSGISGIIFRITRLENNLNRELRNTWLPLRAWLLFERQNCWVTGVLKRHLHQIYTVY